jgi:hypothetical protein
MLAPRKLALSGVGDLNCPGDPGCPGYVAPGSLDYANSLLQEILTNQVTTPPVSAPKSAFVGFFDSWGMPILVGLGILEVLALAGRRR